MFAKSKSARISGDERKQRHAFSAHLSEGALEAEGDVYSLYSTFADDIVCGSYAIRGIVILENSDVSKNLGFCLLC